MKALWKTTVVFGVFDWTITQSSKSQCGVTSQEANPTYSKVLKSHFNTSASAQKHTLHVFGRNFQEIVNAQL